MSFFYIDGEIYPSKPLKSLYASVRLKFNRFFIVLEKMKNLSLLILFI